ncbi:MAG: hypothetical protein GX153_03590, partial [Clostridiaceae bacterium]|nr:hypothetical protein [Clostridiaceae bacterium]
GTSSGATWLWSGTSNGTFRYGMQGLDSGGNLRLYIGSNFYTFDGSSFYINGVGFSKVGHTHSYLSSSGGSVSGAIVSNTSFNFSTTYGGTGLYMGNGDGATETTCNLDIQSWNGIGIKGMAGNPYGNGTRTVWINARHGEIATKGGMNAMGTSYIGPSGSGYRVAFTTYASEPCICASPQNGNWGYLGNPNSRWYWLYVKNIYVVADGKIDPATDGGPNIGGYSDRFAGVWAITFGSTSLREVKENIAEYRPISILDKVKALPVYSYQHKVGRHAKQLGVMVEESPSEILVQDDEEKEAHSIDLYSYTTFVLAGLKEAVRKIEQLEAKFTAITQKETIA